MDKNALPTEMQALPDYGAWENYYMKKWCYDRVNEEINNARQLGVRLESDQCEVEFHMNEIMLTHC